jgi:hypothetical protein
VNAPERRPSIRERRVGGEWTLAGAVLGVLLVLLIVGGLTQTDRGRARVLAFTLTALAPRVQGDLRIERIAGNLLAGVRLYNIELRARDGEALLVADSAFINYGLRSLLGGDMELHELVIWNGEVVLRRMPGDTLWNYQKIFQDSVPGDPQAGDARAFIVRRGQMVNVNLRVETPWEPDPELGEAARDAEIAAVLADTARLMVDAVEGGYLRTQRFEIDRADVPRLAIASADRGGTFVHLAQFTGRIMIWREPAHLRDARLTVSLREERLEFRADPLRLPDSELIAAGVLLFGDTASYNISIQTAGAALADLQWLYPLLPEEGRIQGRLDIETRRAGTLFLVRDLRLQAPGTRLSGSFGLIAGETLQFVDVNLAADPLRVSTVEAMLPTELPVRGLQIDAVEIRPAS